MDIEGVNRARIDRVRKALGDTSRAERPETELVREGTRVYERDIKDRPNLELNTMRNEIITLQILLRKVRDQCRKDKDRKDRMEEFLAGLLYDALLLTKVEDIRTLAPIREGVVTLGSGSVTTDQLARIQDQLIGNGFSIAQPEP